MYATLPVTPIKLGMYFVYASGLPLFQFEPLSLTVDTVSPDGCGSVRACLRQSSDDSLCHTRVNTSKNNSPESYFLVIYAPQQAAGLVLTDTELMTGLPEYRNGGLLLDMGLLQAKHGEVTEKPHAPEEEVIFDVSEGFVSSLAVLVLVVPIFFIFAG